jgi:hypothetical protein
MNQIEILDKTLTKEYQMIKKDITACHFCESLDVSWYVAFFEKEPQYACCDDCVPFLFIEHPSMNGLYVLRLKDPLPEWKDFFYAMVDFRKEIILKKIIRNGRY